jgi:hypothetical protein
MSRLIQAIAARRSGRSVLKRGSSLALGFTGELTDPTTGFLDLRA